MAAKHSNPFEAPNAYQTSAEKTVSSRLAAIFLRAACVMVTVLTTPIWMILAAQLLVAVGFKLNPPAVGSVGALAIVASLPCGIVNGFVIAPVLHRIWPTSIACAIGHLSFGVMCNGIGAITSPVDLLAGQLIFLCGIPIAFSSFLYSWATRRTALIQIGDDHDYESSNYADTDTLTEQ